MKTLVVISLLFILSPCSWAEENPEPKEGPCKKMMDACKAADFAKGDHTMKHGLFKDCMQPLLAGEAVPRVTIASDLVAACKKIKDAKKTK